MIRAQNVGRYPARFMLFAFQRVGELWHPDPVIRLFSKGELAPGEYYRYNEEVVLTYQGRDVPASELDFRSPKGAVGKWAIESVRWGDHFVIRPIIMHNPIGMSR